MTRDEQKEFVRELSAAIADDICAKIGAGKIPEFWDGHELRHLLAHRHAQSASMSRPMENKRRRRYQDFAKLVALDNL